MRYTAGDVLQALLEAQDHRAWTKAEMVKTELSLSAGAGREGGTVTRGTLITSGIRARLVIRRPAPGLIVANGRHLWVDLPQVAQVYRYSQARLSASGNFFLDLASSIRHYARDSVKRRFHPGAAYDESRVSAFELTPTRSSNAGFRRLRVWVDTRRWVVLRAQMDYGASRDDIDFTDIQTMSRRALRANPRRALPKGLFKYHRPKRYELFNMDQ